MTEHPFAKHAAVILTAIGAVAGVWTRFVVIEERQANQLIRIVELSTEVAALRARVESEERATRERFHASDLRLSGIEDHVSTFVVTTGRRRRVR
jgi:hypothetical protein